VQVVKHIKNYIRISRAEAVVLAFILITSSFLRFYQLGYSNFYGDETKTFYLDKTVPAYEFFMNQRKGPVQFLVVWVMEKLVGMPHELWTRLPFALAGLLSIGLAYLLIRKLSNWHVAAFCAFLFSFNGFNIAFSRTIQYQSFLVLFGLAGLYIFSLYKGASPKNRPLLLVFSALSYALALLCHYDAIFFMVPLIYFLYQEKIHLPTLLLQFLLPLTFVAAIFYLPYILGGYFSDHTVNYISRRVSGSNYLPNNSLFTYFIYNPHIFSILVLALSPLAILKKKLIAGVKPLYLWFLPALLVYELIISNPGTHVHMYYLPLLLLSGYALYKIHFFFSRLGYARVSVGVFATFFLIYFVNSASIFVPQLSFGYPWRDPPNPKYHLYLYGFPYARGWQEVAAYFKDIGGVRGVYTNDNDTIAEYYLRGIAYTPPGANFLPQYYIHVNHPQEFEQNRPRFQEEFLQYYSLEKEYYKEDQLLSSIYRLRDSSQQEW
jgi:4-amino-4-deoxy-L-arabinose transferase-like glycosyltransferase